MIQIQKYFDTNILLIFSKNDRIILLFILLQVKNLIKLVLY